MNAIDFLKESIRNVKTVGTVTRSSKAIGNRIVKNINFNGAKCLVELGAGDGAVTKYILKAMPLDCKLIAFELNPRFCEMLRKIDDPRLIVIEDSAEKLGEYLDKYGFDEADAIVSTLPLVMFPNEQAISIVEHAKSKLKKGSKYIQVHYSLLARKIHKQVFDKVSIQFVLFNLPPVYLHVCY